MVSGKLADMEDRNPYVWGVATAAFAYVASQVLGAWFGLAPFLAVPACLAGLWATNSRDDADRGGPGARIVR
jgi:hypothetical protein